MACYRASRPLGLQAGNHLLPVATTNPVYPIVAKLRRKQLDE